MPKLPRIAFKEAEKLLLNKGFHLERTKGSHHIFRKQGIVEEPNLQKSGNKAKPYQVRQIRDIILKYKLGVEE